MHLLGFRFAPRIRDLGETKLYVPQGVQAYPTLRPLIGTLEHQARACPLGRHPAHWPARSSRAPSPASLMLRKLGSYPRQNGLAVALRELGRIEHTLFILDWLQSVELRRRVHAGLNKVRRATRWRGGVLPAALGNRGSGLRAAALPGQRPQPGDGGYRAVEHGVPGTRHPGGWSSRQAGGRRAAAIPVAAGLGSTST
ncbi:Tn3 family transposase [Klebsiella pneumoniae]|nr:Tn3 family transposase [Klebsiella pneumoniae]UMX71387.1 Tn3 family transposase [Klebsiella pneumoniae]UMX71434.1 Tn3 family transposase [Klebsiella pneumoniae]